MVSEAQELLLEQQEEQVKLASGIHGEIASTISGYLFIYLRQNKKGRLFDSSTTFQISPNQSKREPDVAFVKLERLPHNIDDTVPLAPDLAVEIISGSDDWKNVLSKAVDYVNAGVSLVWVIDPYSQSAFVFRPAIVPDFDKLRGNQELDGEPVLPGFKLKVQDIFEGIDPILTTNLPNSQI